MLVLKKIFLRFFFLTCLLFFAGIIAFSQSINVKGKVVNAEDNTPLEGVSVVQQGSVKGTVTNKAGEFTLKVNNNKASISFSYVGFENVVQKWDGKNAVMIKMQPTNAALQDVVVVGYGVQKKINQTGATQTVKFDDAVNQPVTNSGQLMYGKFSGVQLTQGSGLPGADASSVTIRGVGTFGSGNPLVVIDNIQYDGLTEFNSLAPADIESISVLKDASASAIYGARGANGVIVVFTKKGKSGQTSIVYNTYTGYQEATVVPEYLDAVNYARLKNERDINFSFPSVPILRYTEANIQAIIDGSSPDKYANTNWAREILKTAPISNHFLAFSGGNDKTTFRLSLGYLTQEAIVKGKFKTQRFNISLNVSSKLRDWITIGNVTNAFWTKFKGPSTGAAAITGETGIINQFQRSAPTVPVYYSNGQYGFVDGSYTSPNPSFPITNAIRKGVLGDYKSDALNIADRFSVTINFNKHLSLESSGSINLTSTKISNFSYGENTYDFDGNLVQASNEVNTLLNANTFSYKLLNENLIRFNQTFNSRHELSFLLGHSVIYQRSDYFDAQASGFPSNNLQQFNAGGLTNPKVTGTAFEVATQSFFGRINYVLNSKYLFEFNVRNDGSSRFGSGVRYGTFPSASIGWRVNKEKFLDHVKWINDFKIRASYGSTGNDDIPNYAYSQNYNPGLEYTLGSGAIVTGVALTTLSNPNLHWETVKQFNVGLDLGLFKNKLTITADYFIKNSSDVLYSNVPIPASIGVSSLSAQNIASMVNKGLELSANYKGVYKKLNFSVGASASFFARNRVTGLGDKGLETVGSETIIRVGAPFSAYFGYQVVGIFQTQAEVASAPVQFGSVRTGPGDFKYADLSGPNGVPDGIVDAFDRTVIGNPYPTMIYSFNSSLSYKGVDLNLLFEGLGGVDRLLNDNGQLPFEGDRNNSLTYWINRWTVEKPSTTLPRLGGQNNAVASSFYVENVSYLRLKNIELGYSFNNKFIKKLGLNKVRIFVGAQNLITITKMKNFDPERARTANSDNLTPLYKVITFGLNIKL
jgi:TonB-dependent starch-binding outer membrane protein SusC